MLPPTAGPASAGARDPVAAPASCPAALHPLRFADLATTVVPDTAVAKHVSLAQDRVRSMTNRANERFHEMSGKVEARLEALGIILSAPPAPVANYVPFHLVGELLFVSGQISRGADGKIATGKLGAGVSVDQGRAAARICALNLLAQAKAALGDLDRIRQCVKLLGFVNCTPDFKEQPAVMNGCSDLLVEVLGDAGRHARSAVGANALPLDATVEVEAIFQVASR
jgi:enamine deaminase RidA (YjgF/YER057c/UK114 family)